MLFTCVWIWALLVIFLSILLRNYSSRQFTFIRHTKHKSESERGILRKAGLVKRMWLTQNFRARVDIWCILWVRWSSIIHKMTKTINLILREWDEIASWNCFLVFKMTSFGVPKKIGLLAKSWESYLYHVPTIVCVMGKCRASLKSWLEQSVRLDQLS